MKIAITGATGHIGANLCPHLMRKQHQLKLLVFESKVGYEGVEVVKGSILDKAVVEELVRDADVVVHLAAKISLEPDVSGELKKVNVEGTQNVVDMCLKHRVEKLIHFSSIHTFNPYPLDEPLTEEREYMQDGTDYDDSKIAGEKIVLAGHRAGLNTTILCPTSVFGPNDLQPSLLGSAIVDMCRGKVPMLVPGGYDFVDVRDIVDATYEAIVQEAKGEKYLLAGYFLTIKELARLIGEISGKKISLRVMPLWFLKMLLPFFRLQSKLAGKPPIFSHQSLKALMEGHQRISSDKARKDLSYSNRPLQQSIKETLDWFGEAGKL